MTNYLYRKTCWEKFPPVVVLRRPKNCYESEESVSTNWPQSLRDSSGEQSHKTDIISHPKSNGFFLTSTEGFVYFKEVDVFVKFALIQFPVGSRCCAQYVYMSSEERQK